MNIDTTPMYRPGPSAASSPSVATAERRLGAGWAGWAREAAGTCTEEDAIETAIHRGDVASGGTYRTTLAMAGLGRLELSVTHRPSHIAIRLHCESDFCYAWLTSKRPLLERRLTRALGGMSQIEIVQGTSSKAE